MRADNSAFQAALLALALAAVGCGGHSGQTCSTDADCVAQDHCVSGLCVARTSGTSTGSTSGGTTGTSASSSTGGSGSSGTTGIPCGGPCPAPGNFCDTSVGGGTCRPAYTLAFVSPQAGGWVDGGVQQAQVSVSVEPASGYPQPSQVTLGVNSDGGRFPLANAGGSATWTGTWSAGVSIDGPLSLVATAYAGDGGELATTSETVQADVTPPTVELALSRDAGPSADPTAGFTQAYVRDEDPLPFTAIASDFGGSGATASVTLDGVATTSPIDLQALPLQGAEQVYTLTATAMDAVGNVGAPVSLSVPVTRWKWTANSGAGVPLAMPAIGPDGTIYVGVAGTQTASAYNLFAFSKVGTLKWDAKVNGTPSWPPAIGNQAQDTLFVLQRDLNRISMVPLDYQGAMVNATLLEADGGLTSMAVGDATLAATQSGDTAYATALAGTRDRFFAVQEGGRGSYDTLDLTPVSSSNLFFTGTGAQAVVADGNVAYAGIEYLESNLGGLHTYVNVVANVSLSGVQPAFSDAGYIAVDAPPMAIASSGTDLYFASGAPTSKLGHVALAQNMETPNPAMLLTDIAAGEPLIDANGNAFVAFGSTTATGGIVQVSPTLQTLGTAPAGVVGDQGLLLSATHLYAASSSELTAIRLGLSGSNFGTVDWALDLSTVPALGSISGPPAIDCDAHGTSLLLVPTSTGLLAAFVVDDSGVDATAAWPKVRHDALNSGDVQAAQQVCP